MCRCTEEGEVVQRGGEMCSRRWCRGGGESRCRRCADVQRWERWCRGGAEVERCVVGGAEVMQRGADAQVLRWRDADVQSSWCRGGEVRVGWQMCRCTEVRGAVVERCRDAEMQRCRYADVQICRGGELVHRWRGADVQT